MEQRFIVNGINNDKIELVSNYDVRKLNRLLDAKDKMWLTKIKQFRNEVMNMNSIAIIQRLDKLIAESEV